MQRRMKFHILLIILGAVLLSSCGGGSTQIPATNPIQDTQSSSEDLSGSDEDATPLADENTDVEEQPADSPKSNEVPEDVPVMSGAYNLQVIRDASQVNYQVDGDIETAMAFYEENLPLSGWTNVIGADSAVGAIGSMSRENEAGDILSINMSYNQNGNFVILQIAISRTNP